MKASEELKAARDELWTAMKPLLVAYEERTGLSIIEIVVERPMMHGMGQPEPWLGTPTRIRLRTNSGLL